MNHLTIALCATSILFFSCNNNSEKADAPKTDSSTIEQPVAKGAPVAMPDSAAMMKAWQEFATPGDMHKWMEKTNGTWEAEVSSWMAPDAPPMKSKSTNVQSSAMGAGMLSENLPVP